MMSSDVMPWCHKVMWCHTTTFFGKTLNRAWRGRGRQRSGVFITRCFRSLSCSFLFAVIIRLLGNLSTYNVTSCRQYTLNVNLVPCVLMNFPSHWSGKLTFHSLISHYILWWYKRGGINEIMNDKGHKIISIRILYDPLSLPIYHSLGSHLDGYSIESEIQTKKKLCDHGDGIWKGIRPSGKPKNGGHHYRSWGILCTMLLSTTIS